MIADAITWLQTLSDAELVFMIAVFCPCMIGFAIVAGMFACAMARGEDVDDDP